MRSTENRLHPVDEFVEHLARLFEGGAGNLLQPLPEARRRQHLRLEQLGRLVLGPKQPQFDTLDGEDRASDHEMCEIARVFTGGGVVPLLAKLGNLCGLARHHPRA